MSVSPFPRPLLVVPPPDGKLPCPLPVPYFPIAPAPAPSPKTYILAVVDMSSLLDDNLKSDLVTPQSPPIMATSNLPFQLPEELAPNVTLAPPPVTAKWNPTWQQTTYANTWWIEYVVSAPAGGTVLSVYLQVGTVTVPLTYYAAGLKWRGGTSFQIPSGTSVTVHAANSLGQVAQTVPFRYLVDLNPLTDLTK